MIQIGKHNTLPIHEITESGLRLGTADDDVLLPRGKAPRGAKVGERLKVFVYTDSEDRPVATTQEPKAVLGDFACLEVIDVSRHGAFLDWGLDKDLIVPTREQHEPLRVGDRVVVAVVLDRDERVTGCAKLAPHFDKRVDHLEVGHKVEFLVYGQSERGIRVVVDNKYSGMLYRDQTFRSFELGDTGTAWIQGIRPDGRLDLGLRAPGRNPSDDARSVLMAALQAKGGFLSLTDSSSPQAIQRELQMSKKAFKRAVGGLYKARKIAITESGIRWLDGAPGKPSPK